MKNRSASLGICLGASTISLVEVQPQDGQLTVTRSYSTSHYGNIQGRLLPLLADLHNLTERKICVTGRRFRSSLNLSTITEPEAVEAAIGHSLPEEHPYRLMLSAGGETFLAYHLDNRGTIADIHTGNKCASGTGEFFLQQLRRMNISLEEAATLPIPERPLRVSGRCSVFCKSDCTHALNKGEEKKGVVAGLCKMMADKLLALAPDSGDVPALLVGGCANNHTMVHYLRQYIANLHIPAHASCFEALGAAIWAQRHQVKPFPGKQSLFTDKGQVFSFHPPLEQYLDRVTYTERPQQQAVPGDRAILGLDVGSTTTKGVIVRCHDREIIASRYLRTNGDPVQAARAVYTELDHQLPDGVHIIGLGVTGSGRQIAGLHAQTPAIINEIIAHATGAAFFNPRVDTIFEIGGQDAKYTFLINGVPSDYAMNEACSAGTGSFLEEAAEESLGIDVTEIGSSALTARKPLNFNDQCAAFIGSDIKSASQLLIETNDIVAGLVYSVCLNFINRVKGNRPVGKTVFVQGGVCYNPAVPAAIAGLTGKKVVVPPHPGLMGAFGVALEVAHRLEQGQLVAQTIDLQTLATRKVEYATPFVCPGGHGKCDRKCEIARIKLAGKIYPFGGICNRFDTIRTTGVTHRPDYDLVEIRQQLIDDGDIDRTTTDTRPAVRMNRSFFFHSYFPFFRTYFEALGYRLLVPDHPEPKGKNRCAAPFCLPVEIAHQYGMELTRMAADFTFLPHIKGLDAGPENDISCTCVFVQGEPYYLRAAFPELEQPTTLSPTIDFSGSKKQLHKAMAAMARDMNRGSRESAAALLQAMAAQQHVTHRLKALGRQILARLEATPGQFAVVLFGRPYNSFAREANKGINLKFASRAVPIIPFDLLPLETEQLDRESNMFWAMGSQLLKCARYVAAHPQLYGVYITNFSCGPDSFILTYFRDIMGKKPSLTLELDSHTADAGIETRIEAFLDIVRCRGAGDSSFRDTTALPMTSAAIVNRGKKSLVRTSGGDLVSFANPRVRFLLPAMGRFGAPLLAAAFARVGIQAYCLAPATTETLHLGRANSSCKECLPLQTTTGSLIHYLQKIRPADEISVYLMPSAPGPCRFGQYHVHTKRFLAKQGVQDVAVFSPSSKNCYGGMGRSFSLCAWRAIIIGDIFNEIWATLQAAAADITTAMQLFDDHLRAICAVIHQDWPVLKKQLQQSSAEFATIKLKLPYHQIPKISLVGEIYVRHDPLSLQQLVERLAKRGFIVRTAENREWFQYLDWLIDNNILGKKTLGFHFIYRAKRREDSRIRALLAPTGLFHLGNHRVSHIVKTGARFLSPQLCGEAILTVGSAFDNILNPSCGVISIGPFGCMPTRVAEAILKHKFTSEEKYRLNPGPQKTTLPRETPGKLPYLAIETDGGPFPQIIEARLEAFCLQAERLHQEMLLAN